jgi:glycosyltransferase involved in cell wall biosynthesis
VDETVSEQLNNRVLFVGLVWPEPTSTAAGQNILSYIQLFLNKGYEVTFACAAEKTEQSAKLTTLGVKEQSIALNDSSFNDFVSELAPDIAVFDRFISEEQFAWRVSLAAPKCMKILDCEDLHFLRDARQQAYKNAKLPIDSNMEKVTLSSYLYSDMCKRELASIMRCDLSILLSYDECQLLNHTFSIPSSIIHYCPFLFSEANHVHIKSFDERVDFVSIGSFRHAPNWDAVLTLKQSIWPSIRKALPKARCHIYGSYLSPKAKQLENKKDGFLVHGYAKDAHDVINDARVLLAPLNFGAGIKGKLVDAMQCRTPSITTSIGAEGLMPSLKQESENSSDLNDKVINKHLLWPGAIHDIDKSTEDFIQAAIAVYSDEETWNQASEKCPPLFSSIFNYEIQAKKLIETIDSISNNLTEHRQKNFLGQVLQHHTLSSTKYMSQWIEAKTRLQNS